MKFSKRFKASTLATSLIFIAFGCNEATTKKEKILNEPTIISETEQQWTQDQADVKAAVEKLLIAAGNHDLQTLQNMVLDKANMGIGIFRDEVWKNSVSTMNEYFERAKKREPKPYFEPVNEYEILVNKGQIALVWADATLHSFGVPRTNNIDNFTLIKEEGEWKFLSLAFTNTQLPEEQKKFDLAIFAKSYAQVWSGIRPEFVAMFFEENGKMKLNENKPAEGKAEITEIVQSFMQGFPDMNVSFDSLVTKPTGTEFHWTLTGTNTGPGGTGNTVKVSGYELWQMGKNNRILESQGHFPTEEYNRQLGIGMEK